MDDLEQVVPYVAPNGNKYLIKFKKFVNLDHLDIDIVDVSLINTSPDIALNSLSSFKFIADTIKKYLLEHNVILYYYCDTSEVFRRDTNILPQKYRNMMFCSLIKRYNSENFYFKNIVIEDPQGDHYICFISKEYNEKYYQDIYNEINNLK